MADLKLDLGKKAKDRNASGKGKGAVKDASEVLDTALPPASKVLTSEECEGKDGVVTRMVVLQRDYGNEEKKPTTMSDIKV